MSFAIITDSTSDISPARAQELGIYVIPLHVIIEGEDLLDQVQITAEEYVARMAGSEQLPHTSQPSAGEFKALFDRVRADGHDSASPERPDTSAMVQMTYVKVVLSCIKKV